ncbi:MAG: hypothetical protein JJU11_15195, partial [Candidatus Sumerlaeia bacterium]|nr:hypothetical protein [Candidatus Sumerlaeia bacterium]
INQKRGAELVGMGNRSKLREQDVKRVALALQKSRKTREVLDFLQAQAEENEHFNSSPDLLEIKGKALIDMAKINMDNARKALGADLKARAWETARDNLRQAEKSLITARRLATHPSQIEYIDRDLEFVQRMKEITAKPSGQLKNRKHPK